MKKFAIFPKEKTNQYKELISSSIKLLKYHDSANFNDVDYVFLFGGDGTFLKFINQNWNKNIKIIFVNEGKVGFNSSIEKNELKNLELNDKNFDSFYIAKSNINNNCYYCFNEMWIECEKLSNFEFLVNSQKFLTNLASKIFIVNYLGTTGVARSYHKYPIILRNNPCYIVDVLESPQYKYHHNLNQYLVLSNKEKLEIYFKTNEKIIIKIDNVKYLLETNKILVQQVKTKAKVLNFNDFKNFTNKIKKLF